MSRRNIEIGDDQWKAIKAKAAIRGQTLSDFFAQVLDEALSTDTKPWNPDFHNDPAVLAATGHGFNTRPFTPVPKKGK